MFNFGSDGAVIDRNRVGCPVGTTKINRQKKVAKIVAMKIGITLEYKRMKDKGEKMKKRQLKCIIDKHKLELRTIFCTRIEKVCLSSKKRFSFNIEIRIISRRKKFNFQR